MKTIDISLFTHEHSFGQDEKRQGESRTLIVIMITAIMMVVEISTGIAYGSMALLADGMHMASHTLALGINFFAYIYARRHAHDKRFSFGTGKVNALGGYTGAILLALFAIMMAWESVERLIFPTEIVFNSAIFVAVIGLVVNGASVFILGDNHSHDHHHGHDHTHEHHADKGDGHAHHHEEHHDHNLRSAYLHVMADALTSVTAIVALLAAKYFGWIWMDPLMGIVGSLLVAKWSVGLLKQASGVLLDQQASPQIVDSVRHSVEIEDEVMIADLHIWSIGPNIYSVIIAVVTSNVHAAEMIRGQLDSSRFPHITVEVYAPSSPPTSSLPRAHGDPCKAKNDDGISSDA
jgi:cation diffusion facilitator family transporter